MNYRQRKYPLFSACGLNCGLCPRYHTDGSSKCPGCAGDGFSTKHPSCGVLSCCQRHDIAYCFQCAEYPCKKYDGADLTDSFITHRNQFKDFAKAKAIGLDAYEEALNKKIDILRNLLESYDDGRRKSFFCVAVNLLEVHDIEHLTKQIANEIRTDMPLKEKAVIAAHLFQAMAEERNIDLKLRKKAKLQ